MPGEGAGSRGAPPGRPLQRYPEPRDEGQPWWIWLLALLAILLLGTMGFLGAQLLGLGTSSSPTPTPTGLTVPNWVGDPITGVKAEAERRGLILDIHPLEPSDTVPVDHVIRTEPTAGTAVERGDTVEVWVSSGKEQVPVPNLIGQTRQEATDTLRSKGLELGQVSSAPSDRREGEVISTTPSAGVEVGVGSQVDIVLSQGPTPTPSPSPTPVPTPSPTPVPPPPSALPS